MAEQEIKLTKNIISNQEAQKLYEEAFNEVIISDEEYDDDKLINIYNDLFYQITKRGKKSHEEIISKSYNIIDEATDIYQIASFINKSFDKEEKIRLIYSTFKIAYSDKKFHYMERHLINQIANILNLHKKEIIEIKKGILI